MATRAAGFLLLGSLAGCRPGLPWRLTTFEAAHKEAQAQNRLTFVYFRAWYLVDSTRFEDDVLSDPAVRTALSDFVCVPLSYDVDRNLAGRWGLRDLPAYAIVDPAGVPVESAAGPITLRDLLAAIDRARQRFAPHTQPTTRP